MALAVFEFLKELRLSLIIEVCVLDMFDVFDPDGGVLDLGVRLNCLTDALADGKRCGDRNLSKLRLQFLDRVGGGVHGLLRLCCLLYRGPHDTVIVWTLHDVGLDLGHCSLDLERVLNADDLVHSVAKAGQFLTSIVQLVLAHVIVNECLKLKLPLLVLSRKRFDDLYLFCCPLLLGPSSYHNVFITLYVDRVRAL